MIDLAFFLIDIPMTFLDEYKGSGFRKRSLRYYKMNLNHEEKKSNTDIIASSNPNVLKGLSRLGSEIFKDTFLVPDLADLEVSPDNPKLRYDNKKNSSLSLIHI